MKKPMVVVLSVVFVLLATTAFAQQPKVTWGGLFYMYNFFHRNTDFNDDTDDGNTYAYMHADVNATVDFGQGVKLFFRIGSWGQHGQHGYLAYPPDPRSSIMEAHLTLEKLFDSNWSFKIGKQPLLYGDGLVMFDGGEERTMGAKLMYRGKPFSVDLFYYRVQELGGIPYVGTGTVTLPGNWDLVGAYATLELKKTATSAYFVWRRRAVLKDSSDKPFWFGVRSTGSAFKGLNYKAELAIMGGSNPYGVDYTGMAFIAGGSYAFTENFTIGATYVSLSGDKADTKANEMYESTTNGPFTYGFYKGWVGLGPAQTLTTGYGFAGIDPNFAKNRTMTNINSLDAYLSISTGPVLLRFDVFHYARNWVPADYTTSNMGNEIAVLIQYNYRETVTFGFTAGVWMPGDYIKNYEWGWGPKTKSAIGGYFFFAKSF